MTTQPEPGTAPATPPDEAADTPGPTDDDAGPTGSTDAADGEPAVVLTTDPEAQREDSLVDPTNS